MQTLNLEDKINFKMEERQTRERDNKQTEGVNSRDERRKWCRKDYRQSQR